MIKIACMGDNVVDINYIDGIVNPGGNCVNVAVYCSQLGHKAAYVGVLADDAYGRVLTDSLDKQGVEYTMSPVLHGETGRCFINLVDGDRIIGDENNGGLVKSHPLEITDEILAYLGGFDLVHTSCYSYIDEQLIKVKEAGIPLLYDFSTEWNEENVAGISDVANYILFSGRDDMSQQENLSMLKKAVDSRFCSMAIMTMGIKGAWVYDGTDLYTKEPYNISGGAVDTTGCGDSWISGFITTYVEITKRMEDMIAGAQGNFILEENERDVRRQAIQAGMCMGNLKARHTCRVKGAYGCGVPVSTVQPENEKINCR